MCNLEQVYEEVDNSGPEAQTSLPSNACYTTTSQIGLSSSVRLVKLQNYTTPCHRTSAEARFL